MYINVVLKKVGICNFILSSSTVCCPFYSHNHNIGKKIDHLKIKIT